MALWKISKTSFCKVLPKRIPEFFKLHKQKRRIQKSTVQRAFGIRRITSSFF